MTQEQVIDCLRRKQGDRTQGEFAEEIGISRTYLCDIYAGRRDPSLLVLQNLGIEREVIYKRIQEAVA